MPSPTDSSGLSPIEATTSTTQAMRKSRMKRTRSRRIIGRRVGRSLSFGLPWNPSGPSWLWGEVGGGVIGRFMSGASSR